MTELILGSRGSGKSTELIKRSAEEGLYILTSTRKQAEYLVEQAKKMGYNIPFPVTWEEFVESHFRGSCIRRDGLLIDDAENLLPYIFKGIPVKAVTWTKSEFKDLDSENYYKSYADRFIYKIPDDILTKIPDYFWPALAGELVSVCDPFIFDEADVGVRAIDFITGTAAWDEAFKATCKKLGMKWLNEYRDKLEWYDSDRFDDRICDLIMSKFVKAEPESCTAYYKWLIGMETKEVFDSYN